MPKSKQTENEGSLTKTQQVVALTAIQKGIKDRITELRDGVVDDMTHQYHTDDGVDRRTARINGVKIGTASLRFSTSKYEIVNVERFEEYLIENAYADVVYEFVDYEAGRLQESLIKKVESGEPLQFDDFAFAFKQKVTPTKSFDTIVHSLDGLCTNKVTGEIIPGVVPKKEEIIGITVKTEKPVDVVNALVSGCDNPLQNLLGDGEDVQG